MNPIFILNVIQSLQRMHISTPKIKMSFMSYRGLKVYYFQQMEAHKHATKDFGEYSVKRSVTEAVIATVGAIN